MVHIFLFILAAASPLSAGMRTVTTSAQDECDNACNAAYANAEGASYHGTCLEYCKKAAAGKDPCLECKYVTDMSGFNAGCQYFMKAFNDANNPKCYHKAMHDEGCPSSEYMEDKCNFVGFAALYEAIDCEKTCNAAYPNAEGAQSAKIRNGICLNYCKKAKAGKDRCETCKYVPDSGGKNEACQFHMTVVNDPSNPKCYRKAMHDEGCPSSEYMEDKCNFVGYAALYEAIDCEKTCNAAYPNAEGAQGAKIRNGICLKYCKKAEAGKDRCETCKYVPDSGGKNEACQFHMTVVNDPSNPKCYRKAMHDEGCPRSEYMEDKCNFVGWDALHKAGESGELKEEDE